MQTDPTEADSLRLSLLVREGLPRHETRWARVLQVPASRELRREERIAPTMKLSVSYVGNSARDNNKNF
jgi:hypothetical protein